MKFNVGAVVTVSIFTVVEAESESEALEIAEFRPIQSLCHQCSSGEEAVEWALNDGLDGIPYELTAESAE